MRVQLIADRVQRLREHRIRVVQRTAHPQPLTPLPREQERHPATGHRTLNEPGRRAPLGERLQAGQQPVPVLGDQRRALLERRAAHGERVAEVGRPQFGPLGQVAVQLLGLLAQPLRRPGREQHRQGRPALIGGLNGLNNVSRRGLFHHGVGIGAAEAEGGDARAARMAGLRPLHLLRQQADVARRPVDMRGGLVHVQCPRQHPVPHGEDHLHHAGDTGRGLRVADVGLDGAEQQRLPLRPVLPVRGEQRLRLDRVAQPGARAMGLDRVHLGRGQTGTGQRLADDALLRRPVRRRQTIGRTVLVDGRAAYEREHRMAIAARVREPLDEQHADALAPAGAVRTGRERLDPAVLGEPALTAEVHEHTGRRHHGHTARERDRALAAAQRLDRRVEGDQRGGAGGVDGDRRAFETEGVGEPARNHAGRVAGAHVAFEALRVAQQ
ncbi:hypothetical protein GCM10010390_41460 [Streptomyces mordarskii]|uniref:Uncharacterized protein n=1 Tax=Streptomyces mordarskii TaxID=1226758 RepID=A0ABN1D6B6_9ACTN